MPGWIVTTGLGFTGADQAIDIVATAIFLRQNFNDQHIGDEMPQFDRIDIGTAGHAPGTAFRPPVMQHVEDLRMAMIDEVKVGIAHGSGDLIWSETRHAAAR